MKLYKVLAINNYLHTPAYTFEHTFVVAGNEDRAIELAMEYWHDITMTLSIDKTWNIDDLKKELVLA